MTIKNPHEKLLVKGRRKKMGKNGQAGRKGPPPPAPSLTETISENVDPIFPKVYFVVCRNFRSFSHPLVSSLLSST